MSSRFTAIKLPIVFFIYSIYSSTFFKAFIQKGTTSTPPNILKSRDLPYITGRPARGPIFPRPRIAVPSVTITAVLQVLQQTFSLFTNSFKLLSLNIFLRSSTF